jgi:hypothetical protein
LGVACTPLHKISEKKAPNISTYLGDGKIDFIINIPRGRSRKALSDGFRIRRMAIDHGVSLISNLQLAKTFIKALHGLKTGQFKLEAKAWDEYEK